MRLIAPLESSPKIGAVLSEGPSRKSPVAISLSAARRVVGL